MQVVNLIAPWPVDDETRRVVADAVGEVGAILTTSGELHSFESLEKGVRDLVSEADAVVAYVPKVTGSLLFEIGIAFGLRKPILLLSDPGSEIPFHLRRLQAIAVRKGADPKQLRFRIAAWLQKALEDEGQSGPRTAAKVESDLNDSPLRFKLESVFEDQNHRRRSEHFESWFTSIAQHIDGWEIVEPHPDEPQRSRTYDLIIWNHLSQSRLEPLGNPIPVEVKASKRLQKRTIEELADAAKVQGLKSVILVSLASVGPSIREAVKPLFERTGVTVLILDREDLLSVNKPKDILRKMNERLMDFRSA